jgi:thiol-disulfide isomerase/thioredoxin
MKARYLVILALVFVVPGGSMRAAMRAGDQANVSWRTTNGMIITNNMLKGHLLVVDFWASWCGPCMIEAPEVVKDYRRYAKDGVGFVGVSLDDDATAMRQAAARIGYIWPQICSGMGWHDPIAQSWGVNAIPDTFILGPDAKILWTGYPNALDGALQAQLKKHPTQVILAGEAVKLLTKAADTVSNQHDWHAAVADLMKISPQIGRDASLIQPVKKFLFAVRRNGTKAVEKLRKNSAAMNRLSSLIGRGQVMLYLGL